MAVCFSAKQKGHPPARRRWVTVQVPRLAKAFFRWLAYLFTSVKMLRCRFQAAEEGNVVEFKEALENLTFVSDDIAPFKIEEATDEVTSNLTLFRIANFV